MEKDYALAKHLHNMGFEFLASYLGNLSEQTNKDANELKAEIEKLRADKKCPICGGIDKCISIGGTISQEPLTMEDWKELYEFLTEKELPFIHDLIARARARNRFVKLEKKISKRLEKNNE